MPEVCQPPDPNPRRPQLHCPPGAADCHVHLYGPNDRYPPSPTSRFSVPDALPADCAHLHAVLGIERVVIVQPSGYGLDNRRQLDAMAELGRPARAVLTLPADISDRELTRLHGIGVRGIRFAVGHSNGLSLAGMTALAGRIAEMGWHVQLHILRTDGSFPLVELESTLAALACDVVIDHVATIPARYGTAHPEFQALSRLLAAGRCWVKLSCGYRLSGEAPPYFDMVPLAQALVRLRPDRLVWGSDWPHVNFKGKMPNTTEQLDYLLQWLPDENDRRQILVDNPAILYDF